MRYDCGSLALNPRQSPIFRFLQDPPIHYSKDWPEEIAKEATIFVTTPGISINWLERCAGITETRQMWLKRQYPQWTTLGFDNITTATYDDAVRYVRRGPRGTQIPFWAIPFYLADKKSGMGWHQICSIWGSRRSINTTDFLKDQSHVLHSSSNIRRW